MMECVKQCYILYKHTVVNKNANDSSEIAQRMQLFYFPG